MLALTIKPFRSLLWVLVVIVIHPAFSQGMAGYNDFTNRFWVFDHGDFFKAEYLEIESFQIGGQYVAYLSGRGDLKAYYRGETLTLLEGNPVHYTATDHLLGFSLYDKLFVFENGTTYLLSNEADGYIVEDSLIVWHNRLQRTVEVYYNGEINILEDGLIHWPLQTLQTGDNILAWVTSYDNRFKAFYLGRTYLLDNFAEELSFATDRNIVAFYDQADHSFYAFYAGKVTELEPFPPVSYQVGNDMVAYLDNLGRFMLFSHGEQFQISSFTPDFYEVKDNMLIYGEQGFLKTFRDGESETIERYIPAPMFLSYNTISYLNENRFITVYQKGEKHTISFKPVKDIWVYRDIIVFTEGGNNIKVFYDGQLFEHTH